MGTPRSPPTRLKAVTDKWVRPTRRLADLTVGPTDLVGSPHELLKSFHKIPQTTLFRTTTRLGVQDETSLDSTKQIDGYGKCCNLDLGLQVVTDQESGN
jgi:hypothetical protein